MLQEQQGQHFYCLMFTRHVRDNRIMNEETTNFHFAPRPSSSLNHLVPQGRIVPVSVFGRQRSDREGGLVQGR